MERIIKESLNKKYSKKTRKNLDKILEETNSLMKTWTIWSIYEIKKDKNKMIRHFGELAKIMINDKRLD